MYNLLIIRKQMENLLEYLSSSFIASSFRFTDMCIKPQMFEVSGYCFIVETVILVDADLGMILYG